MKNFLIALSCILVCASVSAQQFLKLTDKDRIELAVDMIRKGIQQENAEKLFLVSGQTIVTGDKIKLTALRFQSELEGIFLKAKKIGNIPKCPNLPREDNPLENSAFWDFDIVDQTITIENDTAFVDCRLVLWKQLKSGKPLIISERFVFVSNGGPKGIISDAFNQWSKSQKKEKDGRAVSIRMRQIFCFFKLLFFPRLAC